jgi:hypothetical protein
LWQRPSKRSGWNEYAAKIIVRIVIFYASASTTPTSSDTHRRTNHLSKKSAGRMKNVTNVPNTTQVDKDRQDAYAIYPGGKPEVRAGEDEMTGRRIVQREPVVVRTADGSSADVEWLPVDPDPQATKNERRGN